LSTVIAELRDGVLNLELNRPERLNAVSEELYRDLISAIREVPDSETRVVILSGRGRAFCAGADLKAHASGRTEEEQREYIKLATEACERLITLSVPVICAVQGYAIGAGAELALCGDFLIVSEDVSLGFPEASLGTYVGGGVTWTLPRLVGLGRASELLMLGRRISGLDAAAIGLASEAVEAEKLIDLARDYADRLRAQSPLSLAYIKQHIREGANSDLRTSLHEEENALRECMQSPEWARSVSAFQAGRYGDQADKP
jgi:enoyl-CoA hydratase